MNLVEQLQHEINLKLEQIETLETEVGRLYQALQVLDPGKDQEVRSVAVERLQEPPREVPAKDVSHSPAVVTFDSRPFCGGCGGRMEPATRTLNSGKSVNYLVCTDSGCNNEQLLS